MNRLILSVYLLGSLAFAADAPKPLTVDQQNQVLALEVRVLEDSNMISQAQKAQADVIAAKQAFSDLQGKYCSKGQSLQKLNGTWSCSVDAIPTPIVPNESK